MKIDILEASQLVTAIASVFISGLAIWYTIKSRGDDLEYRELSLRPALAIEIDPGAGKIKLKNVGLGTASIKSIKYRVGVEEITHEINTDTNDDQPLLPSILAIRRKVVRGLVNQDFYKQSESYAPQLEISTFFPSAGALIPINSEENIVEIRNIKAIEQAFYKASNRSRYDEWVSSLGLTSRGEFQIVYCSITDKWCSKTNTR